MFVSLAPREGQDVAVSASALATMRAAADDAFPNETGGLLMGFVQAERIDVVKIIGAGPEAVLSRSSFTPDRDWQYEQIDRLFSETGGAIRYLGEWHSHPTGSTHLSALDRSLLREIAATPAAQCGTPLMAILAGGGDGRWTDVFFRYAARTYVPWRCVQTVHHQVLCD